MAVEPTESTPSMRGRSTDEEVRERQTKIAEILVIYPDIEHRKLAETFGVSESTISRDILQIEESAWSWSNNQAKSGLVFECMQAHKRLDRMITRLNKRIEEDALTATEMAYLMKIVTELQNAKITLGGKGTYQALQVARKKYLELSDMMEKGGEIISKTHLPS